ncbi:ion channel [Nocardioides sp. YIM 152588]|uniref:potassium channel family protein n=1 Tax=Nocardioides sp. YIM 152588 TaxID=3158259 RepID=UPI0032E498C0
MTERAPDGTRWGGRVEAWERRTDAPLIFLAVAFLVAYAWPILDPSMDEGLRGFLQQVSWSVWAAFSIDVVVRVALAERRLAYALHHWYDVVLVVVPMLRPLRLLRVLAFARLFVRVTGHRLVSRVTVYVVGTAVAALFLGALTVLDAERGVPGAPIQTFGEALWWGMATVTTVGYGDFYPVTVEGRLIATGLMVVGIALVGSVTAAVAAWFVEAVQRENAAGAANDAE